MFPMVRPRRANFNLVKTPACQKTGVAHTSRRNSRPGEGGGCQSKFFPDSRAYYRHKPTKNRHLRAQNTPFTPYHPLFLTTLFTAAHTATRLTSNIGRSATPHPLKKGVKT